MEGVRRDAPWCTNRTRSHIRRLSSDGVTYIPRGQCPWYRREAYSRAIAVLTTGLGTASGWDWDSEGFCWGFLRTWYEIGSGYGEVAGIMKSL